MVDMEDKRIESLTRHKEMSEKAIERYLVRRVKDLGGVCLKYYSPSTAGYPDRVCLLPGGGVLWVEVKSTGRKPTKLQRLRHEQMSRLGFPVSVVDSKQGVDLLLEYMSDWYDRI